MLKDCRRGRMLFFRNDFYIGHSLEIYGEFSEGEAELFSQMLRPGQVVVEAGANIGAHTVHLAKLVGPEGMVVAIEPQRVIFQLLCANIMLNELLNVRPHLAAAGSAPGKLKVPPVNYATTKGNFGALSLVNAKEGEKIPVLTIDSMNLPALHLLKVDVQGMEGDVLSGARQSIKRHRPLIYIENDRRDKSPQLIGTIENLGYNMWWHLPRLFNPDNYSKVTKNIYDNIVSVNLICIPKETNLDMQGFRQVSGPDDYWQ